MCNFKIGQEVVALTNPKNEECQPRIKGNPYRVLDVTYCPKTGGQSINISGKINRLTSGFFSCSYCSGRHPHSGLYWTMGRHFAPLQTDSEEADMTEALLEVLERELFQV